MSINTGTPDDYAAAGNQCPACWPAGESPKYVYVAVSDIQYGTADPAIDPSPPNGLYKLPAVNPCTYHATHGLWTFHLRLSPAAANLTIFIGVDESFFKAYAGQTCVRWYENGYQNPAVDWYYGGSASIFDFTESDESTLQENLALMNIEAAEDTYVNLRSGPANTSVKIISSHRENINIAIKEEIT